MWKSFGRSKATDKKSKDPSTATNATTTPITTTTASTATAVKPKAPKEKKLKTGSSAKRLKITTTEQDHETATPLSADAPHTSTVPSNDTQHTSTPPIERAPKTTRKKKDSLLSDIHVSDTSPSDTPTTFSHPPVCPESPTCSSMHDSAAFAPPTTTNPVSTTVVELATTDLSSTLEWVHAQADLFDAQQNTQREQYNTQRAVLQRQYDMLMALPKRSVLQTSILQRQLSDMDKSLAELDKKGKEYHTTISRYIHAASFTPNPKTLADLRKVAAYTQGDISVQKNEECPQCGAYLILEPISCLLVCVQESCSYWCVHLDSTSSFTAYGDEVDCAHFSYTRINHFMDKVQECQTLKPVTLTEEEQVSLMRYLLQHNYIRILPSKALDSTTPHTDIPTSPILDTSELKVHHVIEAIKELKLRHLTPLFRSVWCCLAGREPIRITPEYQERLRIMFLAVDKLWAKYRPVNRRSFLSYSYCLFQFCRLLGLHDYCELYPLSKHSPTMQQMDTIFKMICSDSDLQWEFIPVYEAPLSKPPHGRYGKAGSRAMSSQIVELDSAHIGDPNHDPDFWLE